MIVVYHFKLITQDGDSATILATVEHLSETLKALVDVGSNLNLLNEVICTILVRHITHIFFIIGWINITDDIIKKWHD